MKYTTAILFLCCLAAASAEFGADDPSETILLPKGQPLVLQCPGKEIKVRIPKDTADIAGRFSIVKLENHQGCTNPKLKPSSADRNQRMEVEKHFLPLDYTSPLVGDLIIVVPENQNKEVYIITANY